MSHNIKINFINDKVIECRSHSETLLDISLQHQIPHVHACDGNAKCSTCRVLILEGCENLSPRSEAELEL